jgi:hypothetical protein
MFESLGSFGFALIWWILLAIVAVLTYMEVKRGTTLGLFLVPLVLVTVIIYLKFPGASEWLITTIPEKLSETAHWISVYCSR